MPIDYSRVPTSDLQALRNNDISKVSTKTLEYLNIYNRQEPVRNPEPDSIIQGEEAPTPDWAGKHPNLYGVYGAAKELYRNVGKPAIETVGMVGGGIVGAGSGFFGGAGLGAIPGAAAGSALGYAGARQATEGLDQFFDIDRASRNPSIGQRAKSVVKDLVLGGVGASVPKPTAILNPARQHIGTPATEQMLRETGITLSPAEASGGKTLAQVESLLEQVPFASDIMQNWREANQLKPLIALRNKYLEAGTQNTPRGEQLGQQIKAIIDNRLNQFDVAKTAQANAIRENVLSKLGSKESYETLSKEAQEQLAKRSASAAGTKNQMYQSMNQYIPEGELPFTGLQREAQNQLDELSKLPNQDARLINSLKWATKTNQTPEDIALLESIKDYPENVQKQILEKTGISKVTDVTQDWKTMQSFRNQLSDLIKNEDLAIKNGNPALKGQLSREGLMYKNLRQALDADFDAIAQKNGGEALTKYKEAQEFFKNEYAPIWKNKITQQMGYKNPSELIDTAIKKGSTVEVDVARKALGDDAFNNTVKPAFTNKLLGAGRDEVFNPDKLQKALNDYGRETLLKVYTPNELSMLENLSKQGRLILEKELPDKSILKTLAHNPQNVIVDSILSSPEANMNSRTVLKNLTVINDLLNPQQKEGLKLELLSRIFRKNLQTEQVEAGRMAKNIQHHRRTLEKFFSKDEIEKLDHLAIIGNQMTKAQQMAANPSGTAKNVIAFGASNEIIFKPAETLMRGHILDAVGQAAVAVTSKVIGARKLAKLYLDPKNRNLLMKGMVTPRSTKEGLALSKQLAIVFGNEYADEQED